MPTITAHEHRTTLERLWRSGTDIENMEYAEVLCFPMARIRQVISELVASSSSSSPFSTTPAVTQQPAVTPSVTQPAPSETKLTYKQQILVQRFLYEVKKQTTAFPPHTYDTLMQVFAQTYIEPIELKGRAFQSLWLQFLSMASPHLPAPVLMQLNHFFQQQQQR